MDKYKQMPNIGGINYNLNSPSAGTATVGTNQNFSGASVIIPATVTDNGTTYPVVAIGNYAFFLKESIISVLIPASVTSIGNNAFENCSKLTSVTFLGDAPTVGQNIFGVSSVTTTIYYTSGKTGWGTTFAGRLTAPAPVAAPVKHNYSIYFRK